MKGHIPLFLCQTIIVGPLLLHVKCVAHFSLIIDKYYFIVIEWQQQGVGCYTAQIVRTVFCKAFLISSCQNRWTKEDAEYGDEDVSSDTDNERDY